MLFAECDFFWNTTGKDLKRNEEVYIVSEEHYLLPKGWIDTFNVAWKQCLTENKKQLQVISTDSFYDAPEDSKIIFIGYRHGNNIVLSTGSEIDIRDNESMEGRRVLGGSIPPLPDVEYYTNQISDYEAKIKILTSSAQSWKNQAGLESRSKESFEAQYNSCQLLLQNERKEELESEPDPEVIQSNLGNKVEIHFGGYSGFSFFIDAQNKSRDLFNLSLYNDFGINHFRISGSTGILAPFSRSEKEIFSNFDLTFGFQTVGNFNFFLTVGGNFIPSIPFNYYTNGIKDNISNSIDSLSEIGIDTSNKAFFGPEILTGIEMKRGISFRVKYSYIVNNEPFVIYSQNANKYGTMNLLQVYVGMKL